MEAQNYVKPFKCNHCESLEVVLKRFSTFSYYYCKDCKKEVSHEKTKEPSSEFKIDQARGPDSTNFWGMINQPSALSTVPKNILDDIRNVRPNNPDNERLIRSIGIQIANKCNLILEEFNSIILPDPSKSETIYTFTSWHLYGSPAFQFEVEKLLNELERQGGVNEYFRPRNIRVIDCKKAIFPYVVRV